MRGFISAFAILATAGVAAADTITVPGQQPTIQAAVNAASDGDTISVAAGLYKENVVSGLNDLRIIGAGAVLDGNVAGAEGTNLTLNGTGNTVQGIVFRNGTTQLSVNAAGALIVKCSFIDGTNSIGFNGPDAVISGCTFRGIQGTTVFGTCDNLQVLKSKFLQGGAGGVSITGNLVVATGNQFTNIDDSTALTISGSGAVVTLNKFTGVSSNAISITGDDALVEKNKALHVRSNFASISGLRATVRSNSGIAVGGVVSNFNAADAVVELNKFSSVFGEGITISPGANARVASNKLTFVTGNAINCSGDGATILSNKMLYVSGFGILSNGLNASISLNSASYLGGGGINFVGDGSTVASNKLAFMRGNGIFGDGDTATIDHNSVAQTLYYGYYGIGLVGDNVTITNNSVKHIIDDAVGIYVGLSAVGGGLVEGNKVDDTGGNGFTLNSNNLMIRFNSASRCGTENESGFSVTGNTNTLFTNTATDSDTVGFRLSGDTNSFEACVSKNAGSDGFRVLTGSDANVFDSCSATGSGGEGFDNRGTNTQLQGGTYLKNRTDIANDVIGLATFLGGLTSVTFDTGGAGTQQEVD